MASTTSSVLTDHDLLIIRQVLTTTLPPPSLQHDVVRLVDKIDRYYLHDARQPA